VKEAMVKIKDLADEMGISLGHPKYFHMNITWKPQLDESRFCKAGEHRFYMQLVGIIFLWIVNLV
jgi:hypothetical protein